MRDFDECKRLALSSVAVHVKRRVEYVQLAQALNRISAEDVCSPCNIPSYPTSIKDGYAINCADFLHAGQEFEIQFHSLCGSALLGDTLQRGKAAYVTTGSPLPLGANCIVEIEQTELVSVNVVRIHCASVRENSDVRQVGSDLKLFETVLKCGASIGPGEIGALASIGRFSQIKVFAKPVVGVLATGEELVDGNVHDGKELPYGHVFDCNRPMLLAAISDLGCLSIDLGILLDSKATEELPRIIHKAFVECKVDVLVTTGGVSVGSADCIRMFLETNAEHGFQMLFNRVNVKPGKPVTCAVNPALNQVIFALPGNPVSSLVMFTTLVAPCLKHIKGNTQVECNSVYAQTICDIVLDARPEFQRVTLQADSLGKIYAKPTAFQRSSCVMSLVGCDALICLPGGGGGKLPAGSMVKTLVFSDWRNTTFPQVHGDHVMMYLVRISASSNEPEAEDKKAALELVRLCPESTVELKTVSKYGDLAVFNNSLVILVGDGVDKHAMHAQVEIPGISQFIRERLGIWEEISVRVVDSSLLLDASQVTQVPVEQLVNTALPLLRAALKELECDLSKDIPKKQSKKI